MEFTKNKAMVFPRAVLAGHGVLAEIGKLARNFELGQTGLVITGKKSEALAGRAVVDYLTAEKFDVQLAVTGEATRENVDEMKKVALETRAAFLAGVGGGSKIDIAKVCSSELGIPFISVPTVASHDGIASPRASLKTNGISISVDANVPLGVVADSAVIVKSPFRFLASGCADVIANLTAILDWRLASRLRNEEFSSTAATLAEFTAETIIENAGLIKPNIEESVWLAIKPMIISGISMSVAGSSRPTSGSEHMFSHALDAITHGKGLHGEQCGVGAIMMMYLHGGDWQRIRNALKTIGAPTTAIELGVSKEDIVTALVNANKVRPDRYTILGDKGLAPDAAEKIARVTGVI
ncbi:MAG: NAD(P)-dependent glycerol-1-phosphate dehydrogenase [Thermoplasmata archaeon]|nr:NAD(P)-dependent glycerol-1-phosphate dehydrogenase [Thermoplasmata archaeon]